MKVVVTSGYFNPMHVGHVRLIEASKALGDKLIIIINTDNQVKLKGSVPFMNQDERKEIVEALKWVDEAVFAIDEDGSCCKTLAMLKPDIYAKGGDRTADNIPEVAVCKENGIEIIYNVGGGKVQHSSELINNAKKHAK